ncbi:MAG: ElyC/SanA/YdcF family protein [Patescibacteria group bacterium]
MKRVTKLSKKATILLVGIIVLFIIGTLGANFIITRSSSSYVTGDMTELPEVGTGLLLGTSPELSDGSKNAFFFNRIDAAVALYEHGQIKNIIVSGDNAKASYNEPEEMQDALIDRGIPSDDIYLDYAGFRTLDSVVRAKEVFGQKRIVVISQKFHTERAVFIARRYGIEAYGYNAEDVDAIQGFKTKLREFLARDKVFFDFIFGVQPKFLGKKIDIQ